MLDTALIVLVGLLGGVAVGIQAPMSGTLGQRLGGMASSFIVHLGGMLLSGVVLILSGGEKLREWNSVPWYLLCAGFLGLALVQSVTVTLPRLGAATMVMLIIIGQLLMGVLIDHFGWLGVAVRPVDATRIIGAAVLLVGGYLVSR